MFGNACVMSDRVQTRWNLFDTRLVCNGMRIYIYIYIYITLHTLRTLHSSPDAYDITEVPAGFRSLSVYRQDVPIQTQ